MIQIITLPHCGRCTKVKKHFDNLNISYREMRCDEFPDYCDSLESITNTVFYPMIVTHNPVNLIELYYVADQYDKLTVKGDKVRGYTLQPQINLETLIQSIK